jgi:hypothetical protein
MVVGVTLGEEVVGMRVGAVVRGFVGVTDVR